jgi:hypothetical protein
MSMKHAFIATLIFGLFLPAHTSAQGNVELAGTWKAEDTGSGRGGVPGIPIATTIVIKVSREAVTIDSDTGSARTTQTSVYKLDGTENAVPGPLGWETKAKAAWEGDKLVVTTRRSIPGPNGNMSVEVKDVYGVAGNVLTIERSMGRNRQTLLYRKS